MMLTLCPTPRGAVVVASSFAPTLNNVRGTRWSYNLLNFNASHLFALPSYSVLLMFRPSMGQHGSPAHTLVATASGGRSWVASASAQPESRTVTIKLASHAAVEQRVAVRLAGWPVLQLATASVLSAASPSAENSLERPTAVAPQPLRIEPPNGTIVAQELTVSLPAWSVVVVTLCHGHRGGVERRLPHG